jgi:phosphoglycolate phosphatase-like HAD superfamily hydrolase
LWRGEEPLLSARELSRLAERLPLAIVTGRPRRDAERFLETFGLGHLFAAVISMEDGPAKPDPAPVRTALEALEVERAWLVGDTPDDMQAARAAGVVPIGFSAAPLSSASRTSLLQAGASRVLTDTRDLCDLLASAGEKGVE